MDAKNKKYHSVRTEPGPSHSGTKIKVLGTVTESQVGRRLSFPSLFFLLCNPISTSGFEVATKKKRKETRRGRRDACMQACMHFHFLCLCLTLSQSSTPRPHPLAHSFSLPHLCLSVLLSRLPSHGLLQYRLCIVD